MSVCRGQNHGLGHTRRAIQIDHKSRIPRAEQSITVASHETLARRPWRSAQPPKDLGHVDHDPVWIGQGEYPQMEGVGNLNNKARSVSVLTDSRVHDNR
jgi:hypothetical protein